ncbi:MAG TPA: hemolysin family protein [Thermoanaerobaculia bacterium]|nr:hemolysin family protein [Thermoanaerobaculia bacterium]
MGSSIPHLHLHWVLIAVGCGVLYFVFDAIRSFAVQLSPVRLRQLDIEDVPSGALVQLALVAGVASTTMIYGEIAITTAVMRAAIIWAVVVLIWKLALAMIPESIAEAVLKVLLPLSRASRIVSWPLRTMRERRERAEELEDSSEEDPTDEEVQAYVDFGEEEGIIEPAEGKLLQSIVDFGDRIAREIMTPRIDVEAFDARRPLEELATLFSDSKFSRIPIYETSIDHITGIVHIKEVFDAILRNDQKPVSALARPPYFVSETKKVSELMRELQSEHLEIAVVVDEYGGTAGILSLEDIVEEIVGEIADEHEDEEATIVEIADATYLVSGILRVEELEDKLDAKLTGEDYETVAGLIFTTLGHIPKVGEVVTRNGFRFEVERADRRRIYRVRVSRDPDWRPEEEEEGEDE